MKIRVPILFVTPLLLLFAVNGILAQSKIQLKGFIHQYSAVIEADKCGAWLRVDRPQAFQVGERMLVIQMMGASINTSNSGDFGDIGNPFSCGLSEAFHIASISGDTIRPVFRLLNIYQSNGKAQVLDFPKYNKTVELIDTVYALPWNGSVGGIVAIDAVDSIVMKAPIELNGMGFRGGVSKTILPNNCTWISQPMAYFYGNNDWRAAAKGEGIAAIIPGRETGRGTQANGGGGGNDHNTGGGGGANGGAGGAGGTNNPPGLFECKGDFPGLGGRKLFVPDPARLYLGGGGGAGHGNNDQGTDGANGGGIVIINAKTLISENKGIFARGGSSSVSIGDGAGGGGGGGSVSLNVMNLVGDLLVDVRGGNGGSVDNFNQDRCFGPGGGGGGGVFYSPFQGKFPPNLTVRLSGGSNGTVLRSNVCQGSTNGASRGKDGVSDFSEDIAFSQFPHVQPLRFIIPPSDLAPCEGKSTVFRVTMSEPDVLSYQWQYWNGNAWVNAVGPNFFGANTAELEVRNVPLSLHQTRFRVTATHLCAGTVTSNPVELRVIPNPVADFNFVVNGFQVQFINNSTNANEWTWDFGDTNFETALNAVHTYSAPGTYKVRLTVGSFCGSNTIEKLVTIANISKPRAQFKADVTKGCTELKAVMRDESLGTVSAWEWLVPGAIPEKSNDPAPLFRFVNPGFYTVTLIVSNIGGKDTLTKRDYIEAVQSPQAAFTFLANGRTVTFTNTSQFASTYTWNFGDNSAASSQKDPVHTFANDGAYNVTLLASNVNCNTFYSDTVRINTVSTSHPDAGLIGAFPNPADQWIYLYHGGSDAALKVEVIDAKGLLIDAINCQWNSALDTSKWPAGYYFLKVTDAVGTWTTRIVRTD